MCRPKTKSNERLAARLIAAATAATALGTMLGGCSEVYVDRRDSIALGGGNAVAANASQQTIDPWPRVAANNNLSTNGQRMQSAMERYRANLVTQPVDPMMMQITNQAPLTIQTGGSQSGTTAGGSPAGTGSSVGNSATTTTTTVSTGTGQ